MNSGSIIRRHVSLRHELVNNEVRGASPTEAPSLSEHNWNRKHAYGLLQDKYAIYSRTFYVVSIMFVVN